MDARTRAGVVGEITVSCQLLADVTNPQPRLVRGRSDIRPQSIVVGRDSWLRSG
jgi:hypothetical protein